VHIDTSLQIEQQKVPAQADRVRVALAKYAFRSTSSYARKEFKRAWLMDMNLIYKVSNGCKNIAEVYTKIHSSLWNPHAKRRLQRCLDAIRTFFNDLPGGTPTSVQVIRLRTHLAEAILTGFIAWERSVTHEFDGTRCIRAKERPARAANGAIDVVVRECRPTKIQCAVHTFFSEHQDDFRKIQLSIHRETAPSTELQRTASVIEAANKNPTILCDSKKCSAMSDALIAVDGIKMDHFAANNPREWKTISAALNKPLINPVAPPEEL
jgi:hypothetical protein